MNGTVLGENNTSACCLAFHCQLNLVPNVLIVCILWYGNFVSKVFISIFFSLSVYNLILSNLLICYLQQPIYEVDKHWIKCALIPLYLLHVFKHKIYFRCCKLLSQTVAYLPIMLLSWRDKSLSFRHKTKSYARSSARRKGMSDIQTHIHTIYLTAVNATISRVEQFDD